MPLERLTAGGRVVLLSSVLLVLCSGEARSYVIRRQRSVEGNGTVLVAPIAPNSIQSNALSSPVGTLLQTMGLFDVPHYNVVQHDQRNTSLPFLTKNDYANATESDSADSTSETSTQNGQRPKIPESTEVIIRVDNDVVGQLSPIQPTTIARTLKTARNNDTNHQEVRDMNDRPVHFREKPEYFHTTVAFLLEDVSAFPAGAINKAVGEQMLPTRRLYHHPLERTTKPSTNPMYVMVVEDRPCEGSCCRREPYSGKCRLALHCAVEHLLRTDNTKLTCGTTYQTVFSITQPPRPQPPLQQGLSTPHHASVNFTAIPDSVEIIRHPVADIPDSVETIRQPVPDIPDSVEIIRHPVPDIPDSVETIRHPVADIPDSVKTIRQPVPDIPDSVKTIRHPVADIPDSVKTIRHPDSDIPDSVENIRQPVADISDSVETIRQPVADIPDSVETIRHPVADIPGSIETIRHPVADISINVSSFPDEPQEDKSKSEELDEDREFVSSDDVILKDTPWVTVNTSVESINTYIHNILIKSFDLYNLTIENNNSFTSVDDQGELEYVNASEFSGHDGEFLSNETDVEGQSNITWVSDGGEFDEYFTSNENIDYNYDEYTRDPEYDYEYSEHEYDAEKEEYPDEKHLVYTDRVWNDESPRSNRSFRMETLEVESPNNWHQFGGERDAEWINEENKRRPHLVLSTDTEERSPERRTGEGRE